MKNFILLPSLFLLIACGPSDEEKQNTAIITCNVMGESRNMDASMRIKEINQAREKINEDPFLGKDIEILEAFKYGICINLVLNDPEYEALLSQLKKAEAERARKEQEAEAERARKEQEAEAERARKEQEAKLEIIRKARKAENAKAMMRERNLMLQTLGWATKNKHNLASLNITPKLRNISSSDSLGEKILLSFTCKGLDDLAVTPEIIFENGEHLIGDSSFLGRCNNFYKSELIYVQSPSLRNYIFDVGSNLESSISEVNLYITGAKDIFVEKKLIDDLETTNNPFRTPVVKNRFIESLERAHFGEPDFKENLELYEKLKFLSEHPFKYQIFPFVCEGKYTINGDGFLTNKCP